MLTSPHNILVRDILVQQQHGFLLLKFSVVYLNLYEIGDDK